ncbi:unnamed protein product [Nesidiocoris tenuis]|uniref:Protein wntless n=1 Tax=Nesidiocoris tenuis TaxID=355587 RepID=A0A6H5HL69_9HEMI|nr:unnamed protein product [Nesidiocoris tenuis]
MAGTVLENLSGRKLAVLVGFILVGQVACFLIGGLIAPRVVMSVNAKLGYQNKHDPPDKWTYYASSVEKRNLECSIEQKIDGYLYNCSIIPLFELGSLHHDFYLLNIRLPVNHGQNSDLGHVADMWLFAINQTGGFTKVWLSLKCIFFPSIIGILSWFWRRISALQRKPQVLEIMLLITALSLTLLNAPIELLTLKFDLPFMLLLTDIRQGLFYAALLSFWLVFSAEHLMEIQKKSLKEYWPYFSTVGIGCVSLFMFELCERGIQLRNPFYSIWVTDAGTKMAMALLVIGGVCGLSYLILLFYLIWKVFCNISSKRASLPAMSQARKLHYSGIIYRFNFLMIATLVCACLTVVAFCLGQVSEAQFKFEEHQELEYTSAFLTGVYGMWNIYIFALLALYAPSHKRWPSQAGESCFDKAYCVLLLHTVENHDSVMRCLLLHNSKLVVDGGGLLLR